MRKTLVFITVFFIFIPLQLIYSENIRGDVIKNIVLSDTSTKEDNIFDIKIEDVFSVSFDENTSFLRGIEIEIKVPPVLRSYNSSIAFEIFKKVTPDIKIGIGTYYGKKYNTVFMPKSSKFYFQIPFENEIKQENVPYTTIFTETLSLNDFPLMVTAVPVMKGVPSDIYHEHLTVTVYPLFKKRGNLDFSILLDDNLDKDSLTINIDGKDIVEKEITGNISLSSGRHVINAEVSGGLSSTKTFSISPGKTTKLEMQLNSVESFLKIDVPENTEIYLDGELKEINQGNVLKTSPGEHTILFMIGDYKISKKFNVSPGKDCKISLFLDILVNEG